MESEYADLMSKLKRLDGNLDRAIAARQILCTADNEVVINQLDNTYEAHTCRFLLSAARNELILALRRVLEPASKDKCSFKQLIKLRMRPEVDEYIRLHALTPNDEIGIKSFEKKYSQFIGVNEALINDIWIFRNYHLAHTLSGVGKADFQKEKIIYSELYSLLDGICVLFEDFTNLVKAGCFDNTSKNNVWAKYSKQFWISLSNGVGGQNE